MISITYATLFVTDFQDISLFRTRVSRVCNLQLKTHQSFSKVIFECTSVYVEQQK